MFEEYKITRELRKLKDTSGRTKFLNVLRVKLEEHIDKNPANEAKRPLLSDIAKRGGGNPLFFLPVFNKFKIIPGLAVIVLAILISCVGGAAIASQASLPGEPLYMVKAFTENIRYSLAFSPESKAKINFSFAGERVNEIKQMLEKKGIEPQGLEIALSGLNENARRAAEIIQQEKESGKDVSEFAKDTHDGIRQYRESLKQAFENQKDILEAEKSELKTKIEDAEKANDTAKKEALKKELEDIKLQKKLLESKKEESEKSIERQMESVKKELKDDEKKNEAEKDAREKISEAKKEKAELTAEAAKENIIIPPEILSGLDSVIAKSEAAFAKGDYASAEQYSDETENIIKNIKTVIEKAEKDREQKEDEGNGKKVRENDIIGEDDNKENASSYYENKKTDSKSGNKKKDEKNKEKENDD